MTVSAIEFGKNVVVRLRPIEKCYQQYLAAGQVFLQSKNYQLAEQNFSKALLCPEVLPKDQAYLEGLIAQVKINLPATDSDGDGILDIVDKCPNEKGTTENNGCPIPVVKQSITSSQFLLEVRQETGFQRFFLTVPLLNGSQVIANMRDNVASSFRVYPQGLLYGGQSHIILDIKNIQSLGLSFEQAKALQYVSIHEGAFDAINSYDQAIFSYGFIQFTGERL